MAAPRRDVVERDHVRAHHAVRVRARIGRRRLRLRGEGGREKNGKDEECLVRAHSQIAS
jgi:hypothetical protein